LNKTFDPGDMMAKEIIWSWIGQWGVWGRGVLKVVSSRPKECGYCLFKVQFLTSTNCSSMRNRD